MHPEYTVLDTLCTMRPILVYKIAEAIGNTPDEVVSKISGSTDFSVKEMIIIEALLGLNKAQIFLT